ncbi:MAG TPA: Crp/Fnr family transcriptional regulator, partial [Flavobacteriaceae bacterium]|nr:Crp/Fnr family transcriptional regulator [Flavobacteriaceae bacterium]
MTTTLKEKLAETLQLSLERVDEFLGICYVVNYD